VAPAAHESAGRPALAPAAAAVDLPARRVLVACLIGIGVLVSAHAVRSRLVLAWPEPELLQGELLRILSIGAESGLATWFTLLMMLSTALVVVLIGLAERAQGGRRWGWWFGVAGVMLLASLDEQIQLHEMWVEPFREIFSITTGPLLLAWVIPSLIVAALVAALFLPWALRLPPRTRLWAMAAVALWIAGAAGMEMVDSATFEWRQAMEPVRAHWVSAIIYTTEEAMEMLGVAVLLHTLLVHAREHAPAALGARIRVV